MSDYYEHLEAAWNDLSKEDKEKFISSNIRQQQPIPQDINKWKEKSHAFLWYNDGENDYVREDALIPLFAQLQAQQEEIKQLKTKLELIIDWQYVMSLERNINQQAAEIESLNQQIGQVKESLLFANDEIESLKKENNGLYKQLNGTAALYDFKTDELQECKEQLAQAKEEYRLLKNDYDLWLNRWQIDMDANKKTKAEAEGHRIIAEARGHAIVELTDELDTKNDSMKYLYAKIESLKQENERLKEYEWKYKELLK